MILFKNAVDKCLISKVALDKDVVLESLKLSQASFLDANIVVVIHVVLVSSSVIRIHLARLNPMKPDEQVMNTVLQFTFSSPNIMSFQSI